METRVNYIEALPASEIPPGAMQGVTLNGVEILLANVEGTFYALQRKCPHRGADLCAGTLAGGLVACPRHGAVFDVQTGQATQPAKILFISMKPKDAQKYPVKVSGAMILVGLPVS